MHHTPGTSHDPEELDRWTLAPSDTIAAWLVFVAILLALLGCSSPTGPDALTGTYVANVPSLQNTLTLTLVQSGDSVKGSWAWPAIQDPGSIAGVLSGTTLRATAGGPGCSDANFQASVTDHFGTLTGLLFVQCPFGQSYGIPFTAHRR